MGLPWASFSSFELRREIISAPTQPIPSYENQVQKAVFTKCPGEVKSYLSLILGSLPFTFPKACRKTRKPDRASRHQRTVDS